MKSGSFKWAMVHSDPEIVHNIRINVNIDLKKVSVLFNSCFMHKLYSCGLYSS